MVLCCTREWPDGLTQMFPGIKRCRCAASTLSSLSSPPSASVRRTNISEPASTLLLWNHCWRFFRDSGSRVSDSGSRVSETLEPSRLLCSSLPTVQGFGYCSAHPTEPCTTPAPSRGRLLTAQMRITVTDIRVCGCRGHLCNDDRGAGDCPMQKKSFRDYDFSSYFRVCAVVRA